MEVITSHYAPGRQPAPVWRAATAARTGLPDVSRFTREVPAHHHHAGGKEARVPGEEASWVLGADVCQGAWAGIATDGERIVGRYASTIAELVAAAASEGTVAVVAIDIPIGLPERHPRAADRAARHVLGPRRSSLFTTPIRAALEAPDYATARAISLEATGASLSAQAYALRHKILEVDRYLDDAPCAMVETHPEVCFRAMNGDVVPWPKTVWAGEQLRLELLAQHGLDLARAKLGELAARSPAADIIDAAACAWTALRVLRGQHAELPSRSEDPGSTLPRITY